MTLARKLCGLVALIGSAAPAVAQYTPPRPAPQGPTRLVFVAPPWITNAPRTGIPGPALPQPTIGEVSPTPIPTTIPTVPMIPPAPTTGVTPASASTPRVTTVTRPDVWRAGTLTIPGTVVPAPKVAR